MVLNKEDIKKLINKETKRGIYYFTEKETIDLIETYIFEKKNKEVKISSTEELYFSYQEKMPKPFLNIFLQKNLNLLEKAFNTAFNYYILKYKT